MTCLRPITREVRILYFKWALHDLQITNPQHPDLPRVVVRLRELLAERNAKRCYLRRALEWL